ncbi:MAG: nucleoside triphosphate pyrophosphohydrolase [Beijerinckiaceae bacterium]|nr:nucleoside triphosphate pyrophosphohydrolase [Beijerinckiaceae bacterium]
MRVSKDINDLLAIMAKLRSPGDGCPWDLEQDFASIAPFTIEEAYEVADAIERGDFVDLRDELGDLLLQVVFHAQMAQERGLFAFGDVVEAICSKMVRRHPHVFGQAKDLTPDQVKALWGDIKRQEKADRAAARQAAGVAPERVGGALAGVPDALPALTRAVKLQEKASKVGFDWNDARLVLAKIREECDELEQEIEAGRPAAVKDELGDLFFALANLARHVDADPEATLRGTNAKFERRFAHIEARLAERGVRPAEASLDEMDALWNEAKAIEKSVNIKGA